MKKKTNIMMICFIVVFSFIGWIAYKVHISYNNLIVTEYDLYTKKLEQDVNIVMISDLHENEIGHNNKKLIEKIKNQSPDIILVVGDMVNRDSTDDKELTYLMKSLLDICDVYYSLGNTEKDYIESNISDIVGNLESLGVTVLDNEYRDVKINNTTIRIGGMYDYAFNVESMDKDTYEFLCNFENTDNYKIMMAHRPDSFIFGDASQIWDIDLILSGHTHGGQVILPFLGGLYAADQGFFPKYTKGIFDINRMKIIISSGLGSQREKLPRFNNRPEIVGISIFSK